MNHKLTAWHWLSAFTLAIASASAVLADQSRYTNKVFYTKLASQAGDPPGDLTVLCVGTTLDLNCDGVVNLQDAILYADECATAGLELQSPEGLLNPNDTLQMRCRKAIGVVDAFAALNNRPDFFEQSGKGWLLTPSCGAQGGEASQGGQSIGENAAQSASSPILCSGMVTVAGVIEQHVAGTLFTIPTAPNGTPVQPGNRPGNPNIYPAPCPSKPPNLLDPPKQVEPNQTLTPQPNPCTVPTPEPSVMPGGDSPNVCFGELRSDGTNPCNIPVRVPPSSDGPGHSDEIICASSTSLCQVPAPLPDPNNPSSTNVPDRTYCAGSNPCVPTCDDMPCSEGPFPRPDTPKDACAGGKCDFPHMDLGNHGEKPDESWKFHNDGIFPWQPDLTPKVKQPEVYCGDIESAPTQSTESGSVPGEAPKSCQPVDLVSGHKVEQETDLTVCLVGGDFSVVRNYSTNPIDLGVNSSGGFAPGWGVFGFGWSSPLFEQMVVDGSDVVLLGARGNSFTRFCASRAEWRPCGPAQDVITSGTALDRQGNSVEVYRVTSPGSGETLFFRTGALAGRLMCKNDEYGNVRWFEYRNL